MFYKGLVSPILDRLDSERMHVLARKMLSRMSRMSLGPKVIMGLGGGFFDERLRQEVGGVCFDNPVLLGAGWDKTGEAVLAAHYLGFGAIEVGTVLERSQAGNPKPRQFMVAPGVALNRLGFNSPGAFEVKKNLRGYKETRTKSTRIPVGISVGKNKDVSDEYAPEAHAVVVEALYPYADYFTINVSSPNTPGLRRLQAKKPLSDIVQMVNDRMDKSGGRKPLYIKVAPELTWPQLDDVIEVAFYHNVTGIVAANTTTDPNIKAKYGERWYYESGGLSGDDDDLRRMSTEMVRHIYGASKGKLVVMGVGGVKDVQTALEKIMAGANLVQLVTAIRSEGPRVASNINLGILEFMNKQGVQNISELVGAEPPPRLAA